MWLCIKTLVRNRAGVNGGLFSEFPLTMVLNRYGIVSCPIFSNNEPVRLKGPVSHMATDIRVITWYIQAQIHTQPVLQGLHGHIYKSNVCVGHPYWRN